MKKIDPQLKSLITELKQRVLEDARVGQAGGTWESQRGAGERARLTLSWFADQLEALPLPPKQTSQATLRAITRLRDDPATGSGIDKVLSEAIVRLRDGEEPSRALRTDREWLVRDENLDRFIDERVKGMQRERVVALRHTGRLEPVLWLALTGGMTRELADKVGLPVPGGLDRLADVPGLSIQTAYGAPPSAEFFMFRDSDHGLIRTLCAEGPATRQHVLTTLVEVAQRILDAQTSAEVQRSPRLLDWARLAVLAREPGKATEELLLLTRPLLAARQTGQMIAWGELARSLDGVLALTTGDKSLTAAIDQVTQELTALYARR